MYLKTLFAAGIMIALGWGTVTGQDAPVSVDGGQGYRIDKPGTITFTVGVKIKGKVDKPQVVIFLPKEKPVFTPMEYNKSFDAEILRPLPIKPVLE